MSTSTPTSPITPSSSHPVLGQLITSPQERDAVHVAIAPVESTELLYPGQHVGLIASNCRIASSKTTHVGVVDPFLVNRIVPGDKFWLFLYPSTVKNLRHDWDHPEFANTTPAKPDESTLLTQLVAAKNEISKRNAKIKRLEERLDESNDIDNGCRGC